MLSWMPPVGSRGDSEALTLLDKNYAGRDDSKVRTERLTARAVAAEIACHTGRDIFRIVLSRQSAETVAHEPRL